MLWTLDLTEKFDTFVPLTCYEWLPVDNLLSPFTSNAALAMYSNRR